MRRALGWWGCRLKISPPFFDNARCVSCKAESVCGYYSTRDRAGRVCRPHALRESELIPRSSVRSDTRPSS